MRAQRTFLTLSVIALGAFAGCSGGSKGDPGNRGDFKLNRITTGQGQIYPYRILELDDDGNPTATILNVESTETLQRHANASNGILPPATLPETASLPDGTPGNQFLLFQFAHKLDLDSILSDQLPAQTTSSGLTTAISLLAYDPQTENTTIVKGRGFVNGYTYYNNVGSMELVQAVESTGDGLNVLDPRADGFPMGFSGDVDLVQENSFVFVADNDGDLATLDTFDPLAEKIVLRLVVTNAVRNSEGDVLEQEACTATSVGADPNPANVLGFTATRPVQVSPGNGQSGVVPTTDIVISFNKPVQPADVGTFFSRTNLTPQPGGVGLNLTIAASTFAVSYDADPIDYSDLCNYRIRPLYSFPSHQTVTVNVTAQSLRAIKDNNPLGQDIQTTFDTGDGPGIVNAPVAPDALYIGIGGADPGVAVLDLNGYGQGTNGLQPDPTTGEPTQDPDSTHFAQFNPNIGQGTTPPLAPGTSVLDAGSNGPLTLVQDTNGNTKLIGEPILGAVADIQIGTPLDLVFNNSNINTNVNGANQINPIAGAVQPGNCICVSTHPNPPRLFFPPPNPSRGIFAEEPTWSSTTTANGLTVATTNLLVPGTRADFRRRTIQGLFFGPSPAPPSPPPPPAFLPYSSRQQIGHFLYVLDSDNRQIVVLNSNRFTVLDTIPMSDPFDMAVSPSLGLMAVSNFASSELWIVDIDPTSPSFHSIVAKTRVDRGPTMVAWQPDGESIVTVGTLNSSISVVSGADFSLQKIATGNIVRPIDLVVTERYVTTGNTSNLWYAYILNDDGTTAIFESGPDGTNGIGFNDIIGIVQPTFRRPRSMTIDVVSGFGGFYVGHIDEEGVAVVSRCELTASPQGQQPIQQQTGTGFILPPTFRQKEWTITEQFGGSDPNQPLNVRLSGNTVSDIAFDEFLNNGGLTNQFTQFNNSLGSSIFGHSSKGLVLGGGPAYQPQLMFVALSDQGKIDVIDLVARVKVKTLDVPGVLLLAQYWRQ